MKLVQQLNAKMPHNNNPVYYGGKQYTLVYLKKKQVSLILKTWATKVHCLPCLPTNFDRVIHFLLGSIFHSLCVYDCESLSYKYDKHVYSSISSFQHNPNSPLTVSTSHAPPGIPHTTNVYSFICVGAMDVR